MAEEKAKKTQSRKPRAKRQKTSKDATGISATSSTTNIEVGPAFEESNAELTHNTPIEMDHLNNNTGATALPGEDNSQDYECCECFGTFEEDISLGNGAEWVQCACDRWMHVDCISEVVTDENGRQMMCYNCVI